MINLIMDEDKVKDVVGFRYLNFLFRWIKIFLLSLGICTIGFVYIHEIFGTELHYFLIAILIFLTCLGLSESIKFYLMNKKLNALKAKRMSIYLSFCWILLSIIYTILSISFAYFDPTNKVNINMRGTFFFMLLPLMCINFFIFLWRYVHPTFKILHELYNSKGTNPFNDNF